MTYTKRLFESLKRRSLVILTVVGTLSSTAALAQDAECEQSAGATLASLIESDANIELVGELVEPWKSDERVRVATVEGYIHKSGTLTDPWMVRTDFPYGARTLLNQLRSLDIRPATVNGEPVAVYTSISIVATKTGDDVDTVVALNNLADISEHGLFYTSPQRIAHQGSLVWHRPGGRRVVAVVVGTDGRASSVVNSAEDLESSRDLRRLARAVQEACFIPGEASGDPAELVFIENFATGPVIKGH